MIDTAQNDKSKEESTLNSRDQLIAQVSSLPKVSHIQSNKSNLDVNKFNNKFHSPFLADVEGWQKVEKTKNELDFTVKDLDQKLNRVLAKQEHDYLYGYNVFVKRKEKELRELIQKMNEKNSNSTIKDEKILNLEKTIHTIRDDQCKQESEKEELRKKVKVWKNKAEEFESEKDFFYKQLMDSKKKNKLLKLAINRLQMELEKKNEPLSIQELEKKNTIKGQKGDTFLTDLLNEGTAASIHLLDQSLLKDLGENSLFLDSSTINASLQEPSIVQLKKSTVKSNHKRYQSTHVSRYANIPTENIKFTKFIDLIYVSKMAQDEIKEEIKKYVQALETNYTDSIRDLKSMIEGLKKKVLRAKGDGINQFTEKNELENLFVECVEYVRKDIMKRRLKSEVLSRKRMTTFDPESDEAREFEQSLLKLAQLTKNRVKFSDFTQSDKSNLLDLFVNNEKTLVKIYEALFPHRLASQSDKLGGKGKEKDDGRHRSGSMDGNVDELVQSMFPDISIMNTNLNNSMIATQPSNMVRYQSLTKSIV